MTKKSERSTTDPEKKESTKWEMEVEVSLTLIEGCRSSPYTVKVQKDFSVDLFANTIMIRA